MRKQLIPLLSALTILALALPALADSVYTGDRNFERAWRVYVTRNNPKAEEYFTASAQAYAAALQKDPQERTMRFQSTRVKAGISMYFAGDYDLCIKTLTQAQGKKTRSGTPPCSPPWPRGARATRTPRSRPSTSSWTPTRPSGTSPRR